MTEKPNGLIYVFTGEGKGKTSAALGMAVRSALIDKKVCWIALYKQSSWGMSEKKLSEELPNIETYFMGKGFRIAKPEMTKGKVKLATVGVANKVVDTASESEHVEAARGALDFAREKLATGQYFLVVIDEILNAVSEGLLEEKEVLEVLSQRGETHVVLTGRSGEPSRTVLEGADLVTECKKIKHPYDVGKLAVRGLDY